MILERLREIPLFAELDDAHLVKVCEQTSERRLAPGERLFSEGDAGDAAYIITGGEVEIWKTVENRRVRLAVRGAGHVIGEMSLIEATPRTATVDALTDAELIAIPKAALDLLLDNSPAAARSVFSVLVDRWKSTEAHLRQSQRMAQLGTLSAGLAHELNNPAASVRRGTAHLREMLAGQREGYARVFAAGLDPGERAALDRLVAAAEASAVDPPALDPVALADREDGLGTRLQELGVEAAWTLAPDLAGPFASAADVDAVFSAFGPARAPDVLALVASSHALAAGLHEVEEGASRMSSIVSALKSYSYLDRGVRQSVDVRRGLEDTLLILRPKLAGVTVRREIPADLPLIGGHGGELNQVWTNLIDNAADAVAGRPDPTVVVRAAAADGSLVVEVADNGGGIPAGVVERIFDPFFTTKPPGQGTGLGLDISRSIIVNGHGGDLTVESEPGRTVFRVTLPVVPEET